ncbi:MAG: hypothetical protein Q8N51_04115 [Gammaproteobacteria bacterium]|nr:hypothetical protein [Gammaproteobacteria bacterium]
MSRPGQHMGLVERAILKRWLATDDIEGEHVYDLHLPTPEPVWPVHYTEVDKEQYRYLTMKRVDLLIKTAERIWIIEVTPRVSTRALGALQLYQAIVQKEVWPGWPVSLGLIAEVGDLSVEEVCAAQGVKVWVV